MYRNIEMVFVNLQIRQYNDFKEQGEEGYLAQMNLAEFEKNFGKEATQKAKADYIKTYHQTVESLKKTAEDNFMIKSISNIDTYLKKSSATQLDRPCIVFTSANIGYTPLACLLSTSRCV